MRKPSSRIAAAMCAIGLVTAGTALAMHGKAGLWQMTVTVGGSDAAHMPDMSNVPPQYQAMVQAQMKAHGVSMSGNTITVQHCMTGEEWAAGKPPPVGAHGKNCTMTNVSNTANHMVADMTCSGDNAMTGHVDFSWDSGEHFIGHVTVSGTQNGQPVTHDEKIEGRYLSETCPAH